MTELNVIWPVSYSEIVEASQRWESFHLRDYQVIRLFEKRQLTPLQATQALAQLVEDGLMPKPLYCYKVALSCGYGHDLNNGPEEEAAMLHTMRSCGVPELADLWESDREGFEELMRQGREYSGGNKG